MFVVSGLNEAAGEQAGQGASESAVRRDKGSDFFPLPVA
jgi:hypothetical protein